MRDDPMAPSSLVSIVIPAYNAECHIAATVRSVLSQTYGEYELIIVDDGSSDRTAEIVGTFLPHEKITCIRQRNGGVSRARNTGIHAASGKYVAFLDSDDLWLPTKLARQVAYLDRYPRIGVVFSDCEIRDENDVVTRSYLSTKANYRLLLAQKDDFKDAFPVLLEEMFMIPSTLMIRRECFDLAGMFDEDIPTVEDRDLVLRLAMHCGIACIPEVLVSKIEYGANLSSDYERAVFYRYVVYKKLYDHSRKFLEPYWEKFSRIFADRALTAGRLYLVVPDERKARRCLSLSFRLKPRARTLLLLIASFMPTFFINGLFEKRKSLKKILRTSAV